MGACEFAMMRTPDAAPAQFTGLLQRHQGDGRHRADSCHSTHTASVLRLQRKCACGNHTMAGGKCAECEKKNTDLQRKLAIGARHDPLEREADRVADRVLAAPADTAASKASPRIQRFTGQQADTMVSAPASVDRALRGPSSPLSPAVREDMQQRFGRDFSRVRVHTDTAAAQSTRDVNAHAYTVGHDIVFGAGQYSPDTLSRRRLLAHELTHVVQQGGGAQPILAREAAEDPDANVSLGYLDNQYVGKVAEEVVGSEHWQILREFLRGLWGGLRSAPPEQWARVDRKFQDLDLTNALKYVGGYALGIVEGLWASIKGLAESVITLVTLPYEVGKFLGAKVPALAARYGPRIAQLLMDRDGLSAKVGRTLVGFLSSPAKTARQLGALFDAIGSTALAQVRRLGRGLSAEVIKLLEQPWFEYGRSVGKLVGQILFEVILAVASDAIANIVKEALAIVGRLSARLVTGAVELITSAGRFIGEAVEWVGRLGRSAAGEVGEMFEGLRALLKRLKLLLAELGEEAALTDAGARMPVPSALESRALTPPVRTSPATVAELTPPKVHPSKAAAEGAASKPRQPSCAPFDEPLTRADIKLSPTELRGKHILEEFGEAQQEYRSATKTEAASGWGRAEVRTPGKSVPKHLDRGQLAHKYAELLIPNEKLPRGLSKELFAELPGGSVRLDRVDFAQGVYYEIKPNSLMSKAAGKDQIRIYAEYMNRNFPLPDGRRWTGSVVTYEKSAAIGLFGF